MGRDVVLDIVFAGAIAKEYAAGIAALEELLDERAAIERAIVAKGLLASYAKALRAGDAGRLADIAKAMDVVSKATETFQFRTGTRQVEVMRDERGRFSRYLSGAESAIAPKEATSVRQRGENAAVPELAADIKTKMDVNPRSTTGAVDQTMAAQRQEGRRQAGVVRAISGFQDEMINLFGDSNDVRVIVEGASRGEQGRESAILGTHQPVDEDTLRLGLEPDARMSMGLAPGADAATREKYQMVTQLMNAGVRPDVAVELAGAQSGQGAVANVVQSFQGYGPRRANTSQEKANRHFRMADSLGGYFANSQNPQLAAAGTTLKILGRGGQKVPSETFDAADRASYRYRGIRDNLPAEYTRALRTPEHQAMMAAFDDEAMTAERWAQVRDKVIMARPRRERDMSMRRDGQGAEFNDASAGVLIHLDQVAGKRVSPRDFIDRYTADLAVASLIPEIPADRRASELANKAGYGIPSSGIIIRPDGQAKEMYRGVAEDHYLPFSAKALPELRDGQFVRTRVLGGLTPEDIRVAVVSGARRATVVSGSGVFTLELKPNTAVPGRLASPELAGMADRYERILDQVANSGMYAKDLPAEDMARLTNEAMRFVGTADRNDQRVLNRLKITMGKLRAERAELTTADLEAIKTKVEAEAAGVGGSRAADARLVDDMVREAVEDARAERVRALNLNAEGYALAAETLRLQYPAVIRRVSHESLRDFVANRELGGVLPRETVTLRAQRGASDKNRVEPGRVRSHTPRWSADREAPTPVEAIGAARGAAAAGATATVGATAGAAGGAGAAPAVPAPSGNIAAIHGAMDEATKAVVRDAERMLAVEEFEVEPGVAEDRDDWKDITGSGADATFARMLPADKLGAAAVGNLNSSAEPARIISNKASMEKLAGSVAGRSVALAMIGDSHGWKDLNPLTGMTDKETSNLARLLLDNLVSAHLVRVADRKDATVGTPAQMIFAVPDDVESRMPATIEAGKGAEVIAEMDKFAYDVASPEGAARAAAKTAVDKMVNDDALDISTQFGHEVATNVSELSTLGMLGAQSAILAELDATTKNSSPERKAILTAVAPGAFDGTDESLAEAKKSAATAYAGMFGVEYLRRVLGGGAAGPKVMGVSVVAKSSPPSPSELFSLLSSHVESLPPLPPRRVPLLTP